MTPSHFTRRLAVLAPLVLALAVPVSAYAPAAYAADASLQQVHDAAAGGQMDKALAMMAQVLKDHPNSAKAHYLEAELLAHQGNIAEARKQFTTAENLAPGLPFAKPQSVSALRAQLSGRAGAATVGNVAPASQNSGFPWWGWVVGGGLVMAVLSFFRRRNQAQAYPGGGYAPGGMAPGGYGPQGAPGYGPGMGGGMGGGGMGSGIIGGLAQGAAMGAGFAAGERVIDGLFGGHNQSGQPAQNWDSGAGAGGNQDMGGDDFGISDGGSWDDGGSSGGGNDW